MAVQMEDCITVLISLFPHHEHSNRCKYDIRFEFDHSQGHRKAQKDGLCADHLNVGFGGAQPFMRDSHISKADGCLGPHQPNLVPPTVQSMQFKEMEYTFSNPQAPKEDIPQDPMKPKNIN